MSCGKPIRELLRDCAGHLGRDGASFRRLDLVECVQRTHPEIGRPSLDPVIQGLTANASGGPRVGPSIFRRIAFGTYVFEPATTPEATSRPRPSPVIGQRRNPRTTEVARRVEQLIAGFERYVRVYDEQVPFVREGQFDEHLNTIALRRSLGSVDAALADEGFVEALHRTLRRWGIGIRGSKLQAVPEFREALTGKADELRSLEVLSIEDPGLDVDRVVESVQRLVADVGIVENKAKVVAGTKALHHLLPDLVPPMDMAWTGSFFRWQAYDFGSRQPQILDEGLRTFARIARDCQPSQYVGDGWKTSPTKVLDNALIGYCRSERIDR